MRMLLQVVQSSALIVALAAGPAAAQTKKADAPKKPEPSVELATKPAPPTMGDTTFTVTVKDAEGKPVTDAGVSVELQMPPMPSMNMPEMKHSVTLKAAQDPKLAAAGVYSGAGQIMMAGTWNATVSVKRGGKPFAEKKLKLTAK